MATLWRIIPKQQQKETRRRPPEQDGWRLSRGSESGGGVSHLVTFIAARSSTCTGEWQWKWSQEQSVAASWVKFTSFFLFFKSFYFCDQKKKKKTTSRWWVFSCWPAAPTPGSLLVQLEETLLCDEPHWWHLKKTKQFASTRQLNFIKSQSRSLMKRTSYCLKWMKN